MRPATPPLVFPTESMMFKLFMILLVTLTQMSNIPSVYGAQFDTPSPSPSPLTQRPQSVKEVLDAIRKYCNARVETDNVTSVTTDFGHIVSYNPPLAIVYPKTLDAIQCVVRIVYRACSVNLTVGAVGNQHSLAGQAQVAGGIAVKMNSLLELGIQVNKEKMYADVYPGRLWTQVLNKTLESGLSPLSWTDYLYESVGGTLSNAGVSGQACRVGPQINNVIELDIITGTGQKKTCSKTRNSDLFNATLGGLGQFGIMIRARIPLRHSPDAVKRVRALYVNITDFISDQELLVSDASSFDYVEGFVLINTVKVPGSNATVVYRLEAVKYFTNDEKDGIDQIVAKLVSPLSYINGTLEIDEFGYEAFLDRVHLAEIQLRQVGLWEIPHPWLNLMIPKSKIEAFADGVLGSIVPDSNRTTVLFYPTIKQFWNNLTSVRIPQDDGESTFYLVSFLHSAAPPPSGENKLLAYFQQQNKAILDFSEQAQLGVKQYLAFHTNTEQWKAEFGGPAWAQLVKRKERFDPLYMLGPGQRAFTRKNMCTSRP